MPYTLGNSQKQRDKKPSENWRAGYTETCKSGSGGERSETDRSNTAQRTALTLHWMACVVGQCVYALLRRQPIRTFASFVSLEGMSVRSLTICRENLLQYLS